MQAKWRKKMEKIKVPSSEPYKEVAVDFFNKLLRDEKNYWSDPHLFKTHIQWSFHHALTAEELDPSFDLRSLFLRDGDMFWSMVSKPQIFLTFLSSSVDYNNSRK